MILHGNVGRMTTHSINRRHIALGEPAEVAAMIRQTLNG
jgi:hypothetical protein